MGKDGGRTDVVIESRSVTLSFHKIIVATSEQCAEIYLITVQFIGQSDFTLYPFCPFRSNQNNGPLFKYLSCTGLALSTQDTPKSFLYFKNILFQRKHFRRKI